MITVLFVSFSVLLILSVPVSFAVGIASFLALTVQFPISLAMEIISQKTLTALDNFGLLAIPFFILAGNLMNTGGMAQRLVDLGRIFVGFMPGALSQCIVVGNTLFGAVSGSAVSAAAAVGGLIHSSKESKKYDPAFLASVNIASCPSGLLIPPSGAFILYSLISGGTSISALFLAGYIPGLLMSLAVSIVAGYLAFKHKMPKFDSVSLSKSLEIVFRALPSLLMIVLVMGGIIKGFFTATEASAFAVVYSLFLGFLYKELKIQDLYPIFLKSTSTTCIVLFMVGTSMALSWVLSIANVPELTLQFLQNFTESPILLLLIINIVLLLMGTFMDITPGILIFTPILLPIVEKLGMHPVHFGVVLIFNLCIGIVTPPVGSALFVGCGLAKVSITQVMKYLWPMFFWLVLMLMLVTYVPWFSLALPKWFGVL